MTLSAPVPYFGGKLKIMPLIWERLGEPHNFVDAFCGSGASIWSRPGPRQSDWVETINDASGRLTNMHRAIKYAPDVVADHCDWPVSEIDMHARKADLAKREPGLIAAMLADPKHHDPELAAWDMWGAAIWIGDGWWTAAKSAQTPAIAADRHGNLAPCGVKRKSLTGKIPSIGAAYDGGEQHRRGVKAKDLAGRMPNIGAIKDGDSNQMGVKSKKLIGQKPRLTDALNGVKAHGVRSRLHQYMRELSDRLAPVNICCGDFERVLTPSVTWKHKGDTGILLDPPYKGFEGAYGREPCSDRVRRWCLDNGHRKNLRIVLCGYEGEHDELEAHGWRVEAWKAVGGYGNQGDGEGRENANRERIWTSPACLGPRQRRLFDE